MNLVDLITTLPIKPDLRWAVLGPEAEAFASKLALERDDILPDPNFISPKLQGLLLAGALSAEADAATWLDQLLAALPERATLMVIDWQGDGPLDVGPDLQCRFKRGRLCRQLREAGFSQIELLVNHPLYYMVQTVKQAPTPSPHAGEFVPVATVAELPQNGLKQVEVFGRAIIVANTGREIVAFAQACPHAGASLFRGKLKGRMIFCPLHYYMWNVSSGEPIEPAGEDILPLYPVKVDSATGVIYVARAYSPSAPIVNFSACVLQLIRFEPADETFMPIVSEIIIVGLALLVFGLLLVVTVPRLRVREGVDIHLTLYTALGVFLNLSLLVSLLQVTTLSPISQYYTSQFTLLTLILTFGALTLSFLKRERKPLLIYWSSAAVLLILWAFFIFNFQGWADAAASTIAGSGLDITQANQLALVVAGLGWLVGLVTTAVALTIDFRKRQTAQYLNRLRYWLIATALLSVSGLILFVSPAIFNSAGLLLLTIGSILAGYTALSYHAPDLKLLIGRALSYLGVTAILATVFALGLATAIIISRNNPSSNDLYVLFWTMILAVFLAVIFPPLWRFSHRLLTIIIFGKNYYDQSQVVKHYSQSISSALDLNRLGDIVITLMIETLGIEQGIVFVRERSDTVGYSMRPLSSVGLTELTTGHLSPDSLIIAHWREGKKILSQYDVDVLPKYKSLPEQERAWLTSLNMELYVAVLLQHEIIGLLAFGPRPQGVAYYEEDLELMIALADRVAPAIDNARLFEQLAIINQEVGQLTDQLAGLDQDKADFLSIASHELRTPLTHIHGYSRMLLDLTEDELKDPAYVKTIIQGVAKGSERMKDVVDMMFDVTEANIGEMNLFLGPVALAEVIEQASRPYYQTLDQRRIAFSKSGIDELPAIEADGTRLVQAFENLIGNAVKYTPDGGMIKVEGRVLERDELGPAVEVVVSDTGIGIDPEHHERIFEKFFRVDDTLHHSTGKTKFKGAGPGLGLTLVKGIAEAHGGQVWVESLGHDEINYPGSKFFFVIPVERVEPQEAPKQSAIETRHWRRKDTQALEE